jgi:hypothetical protein
VIPPGDAGKAIIEFATAGYSELRHGGEENLAVRRPAATRRAHGSDN